MRVVVSSTVSHLQCLLHLSRSSTLRCPSFISSWSWLGKPSSLRWSSTHTVPGYWTPSDSPVALIPPWLITGGTPEVWAQLHPVYVLELKSQRWRRLLRQNTMNNHVYVHNIWFFQYLFTILHTEPLGDPQRSSRNQCWTRVEKLCNLFPVFQGSLSPTRDYFCLHSGVTTRCFSYWCLILTFLPISRYCPTSNFRHGC